METFRASISYPCNSCSSSQIYKTSLPSANCYTDPEKARVRITCWCSKCSSGNAFDVKIQPDNTFLLVDILEYESVSKTVKDSDSTGRKQKKEGSSDAEDLALKYFSTNTINNSDN